ncbi:MAG: hypothetical protein ABSB70_20810 [Candidatus Velthaea sp.]
MTTHARFVGSGVQPLVDAVKAAGADPGDLRAVVWQATWARGYEDVVAPAPAVRLKEEGFVVFARSIAARRYATIIDTGHALWALIARGIMPPLGSRVRIVPAIVQHEIEWDVTVLETLGLGLTIRFGAKAGETGDWIDKLRDALARIAEAEIERRRAIVVERRALVTIEPVKPFRDELDALQEELRHRVDAETAGTPEERAAYERGNEKQRKAIVDECKARRLRRFNEELAKLRERIPELAAAHEKRLAANNASRAAVAELEDAASRSRGVSERVATVEHQLTAIDAAGLLVSADHDMLDALGAADFNELARTVELIYDLIPRRAQKRSTLG